MLGFESADHPLDAWMERALELCADHGGVAEVRGSERGDAEGSWRNAFLQAPYLRDTMVAAGVLAETFETSITWDRFEEYVRSVREAAEAALGEGRVTCRLTHVYPDGAAPYFTVLAPGPARGRAGAVAGGEGRGRRGDRAQRGGTITHHHAVGRDHRPWYDRQRPEPVRGGPARGEGGARPVPGSSIPACSYEPAQARAGPGRPGAARACGGCACRCRGRACRT